MLSSSTDSFSGKLGVSRMVIWMEDFTGSAVSEWKFLCHWNGVPA